MMNITVHLTPEQLLALPADAVIALILTAKARQEFILATYHAETAGKNRWQLVNRLRSIITKL